MSAAGAQRRQARYAAELKRRADAARALTKAAKAASPSGQPPSDEEIERLTAPPGASVTPGKPDPAKSDPAKRR